MLRTSRYKVLFVNIRRIGYLKPFADIYLRVRVIEKDRELLRFLWCEAHISKYTETYEMTNFIFGTNLSPVCTLFIKTKKAKNFVDEHHEKYLI